MLKKQLLALFHSIPLANKKMLYLKTVTLNNKQNRKLLQSDLWSSSRLISELDYSFMTVSFSWTIKESPVPVSSSDQKTLKKV